MGSDRFDWPTHIEAPAESVGRLVRVLPPGSGERLVRRVGMEEDHRIAVLQDPGGVLANRLMAAAGTRWVGTIESRPEMLEAPVPESLRGDGCTARLRADPACVGLSEKSVDHVVCGDLRGVVERWGLESVADRLRRSMAPDGRFTALLGLESRRWIPATLRSPDDERDRREVLEDLFDTVHRDLGTARSADPGDLQDAFRALPWKRVDVEGWFVPVRLNDRVWSDRQRSDLVDLVHKSCRARLGTFRRLLRESGEWESDHGALLRQVAADCQQRALRRRKALETDRETGWWGQPNVILTGTFESI